MTGTKKARQIQDSVWKENKRRGKEQETGKDNKESNQTRGRRRMQER